MRAERCINSFNKREFREQSDALIPIKRTLPGASVNLSSPERSWTADPYIISVVL